MDASSQSDKDRFTMTSWPGPKQLKEIMSTDIKELIVLDPDLKEISSNILEYNHFHKLSCLVFRGNQLNFLPSEVGSLQSLNHLEISSNKLAAVPDEFGSLINLKILNISNNLLTEYPLSIYNLTNLVCLNLSGNSVMCLPNEIGNLIHLNNLDVSCNKLKKLPDSLINLKNLTQMNVASNQLIQLPDCFYLGVKNICNLDISRNKIKHIRSMPLCATKLKRFKISHNLLEEIPEWVLVMTSGSLNELDLSHNIHLNGMLINLEEFYSSGWAMKRTLQCLNISECNFSCKSTEFLKMFKNLKIIHLGNDSLIEDNCDMNAKYGNKFWDMPDVLTSSSILTELYLPAVGLTTLPDNISDLESLVVLDLRSNDLHFVNDGLCQLKFLKRLYLSQNKLNTLPPMIEELQSLEELSLHGNQISHLPHSFSSLQNLMYLDLYNNHLEEMISQDILNSFILAGLDIEQNICKTDHLVTYTPYLDLKSNLRFCGGFNTYRSDGFKMMEEEPYYDSCADDCSSDLAIVYPEEEISNNADDRGDSQVFGESSSNWDSSTEDEEDWVPPDTTHYNVVSQVRRNCVPPSILCEVTYVKPNLIVDEGQFDL